jgi:thiol-disulfide isomerase/thioredoxin
MSVSRLSSEALEKILSGKVKEDSVCVIKFYSNDCHLCHNLQDYYVDIASDEKYSDVHFFAFNIEDNQAIEKKLKFNGVPTISMVKTYVSDMKPRIRVLSDPPDPQEKTWYTSKYIRDFIEREK